jgi:N-carbamoylputrescine amidase
MIVTPYTVTVTQLHHDADRFQHDWDALTAHVARVRPNLVLLPELPFSRWFGATRAVDRAVWAQAEREHDEWITRLSALDADVILSTRPITDSTDHQCYNEGFAYTRDGSVIAAHRKAYLPEEDGYYEASWYQRAAPRFDAIRVQPACIGFLICSELWFMQHARAYGKQGAHLIVTPRMTDPDGGRKWLIGGQACAIISGAYSLSSNRYGTELAGGQGWVIDPDGRVLAITTEHTPFATVTLDLAQADAAKHSYPRYVEE